jgi:hypothetical protein
LHESRSLRRYGEPRSHQLVDRLAQTEVALGAQSLHGGGDVVIQRDRGYEFDASSGCGDGERSNRCGFWNRFAVLTHPVQMQADGFPLVLTIKDSEADRLARQLAEATGETITRAVTIAVREPLARVTGRRTGRSLADDLDEIALRCPTDA